MAAVTIPVMAKSRVGHFVEAQILEALGVDMIDESEGSSRISGELMSELILYAVFEKCLGQL